MDCSNSLLLLGNAASVKTLKRYQSTIYLPQEVLVHLPRKLLGIYVDRRRTSHYSTVSPKKKKFATHI